MKKGNFSYTLLFATYVANYDGEKIICKMLSSLKKTSLWVKYPSGKTKGLLYEYRRRYLTMTDRADLYIPFFEKSLSLLSDGGRLSFICTDRWTKNIFGKSLRKFISDNYSLELFVDLYGIEAFEKEVMTYPAITQIAKTKGDQTALIHDTSFTLEEAGEVLKAIRKETSSVQVRKNIISGSSPWLLGSSDQIALINKLEHQYPALEETGCKVFIGAATGANKVYIVNPEGLEIEESRLIPNTINCSNSNEVFPRNEGIYGEPSKP